MCNQTYRMCCSTMVQKCTAPSQRHLVSGLRERVTIQRQRASCVSVAATRINQNIPELNYSNACFSLSVVPTDQAGGEWSLLFVLEMFVTFRRNFTSYDLLFRPR